MSSAREALLGAVRRALGKDSSGSADQAAPERPHELAEAPPPRPLWTETRTERFTACLERASATCRHVKDPADIPAAVMTYLRDQDVAPIRLRYAPDPLLSGLAWPTDCEAIEGVAGDRDWPAGVAVAYAGIAETGSLVMRSGPESPTSLNFLPDFHIAVLRTSDLVDYMEEVWVRLQQEHGGLPRTMNVITGPSRTGDVEQIIQLGAHGPRRLHVLLLD